MSTNPSGNQDRDKKKFMPFFPDYILDEVIAWYVALAVLVVLASLFPAGLEEHADPLSTPAHVKPEWYFLFLYQSLKWVPRIVGVLAPGLGVLILFLMPFLDRSPSRAPRSRVIPIGVGVVALIVIVVLSIFGWLS